MGPSTDPSSGASKYIYIARRLALLLWREHVTEDSAAELRGGLLEEAAEVPREVPEVSKLEDVRAVVDFAGRVEEERADGWVGISDGRREGGDTARYPEFLMTWALAGASMVDATGTMMVNRDTSAVVVHIRRICIVQLNSKVQSGFMIYEQTGPVEKWRRWERKTWGRDMATGQRQRRVSHR
ncbi:hypothetical protein FIBSPDRAFT_874361 [Athelia psychrophila]|uniref:Uncharacterized protein n=1 Tax=Athelia psychrophila TaxID=1759441 RepID=A0A165XMG8_9AGAM|nr:hypothetical protein FIBSPDRAFT_874361 [Fibularhizoctonia sp. CBS 109695]